MDDDEHAGVTKYQNGLGVDDKLSLKTNGVTKYFLTDHLGSTVALTNSSGVATEQTSYDSFGNATTNLSTRYQYTGREYDSFSGFHYYRARWYDANLGRFVSEDPIGFESGDVNLYGYVKNNSANRSDPLGLYDPADWAREGARYAPYFGAGGGAGGAAFAGAAPYVAVGAGGLALGYGVGYYPGQWTANYLGNPFVYGPWNPFGTPFVPSPQAMPQAAKKPTCQPTLSTPWYRNPPLPVPFSKPDNDDEGDKRCLPQYESDNRTCRSLGNPAARARCYASANERYGACLAKRPFMPPLVTW